MIAILFGTLAALSAAPLTIDVTTPVPPATASPDGPVTSKNPRGDTITNNSASFLLNGKPWLPIVGEFHFARYPAAEWREKLLKMKVGGINTVSARDRLGPQIAPASP